MGNVRIFAFLSGQGNADNGTGSIHDHIDLLTDGIQQLIEESTNHPDQQAGHQQPQPSVLPFSAPGTESG